MVVQTGGGFVSELAMKMKTRGEEGGREGGRARSGTPPPGGDRAVTPGNSPRPLPLCPRLEATPARFCLAVVLKRHANSPGPY